MHLLEDSADRTSFKPALPERICRVHKVHAYYARRQVYVIAGWTDSTDLFSVATGSGNSRASRVSLRKTRDKMNRYGSSIVLLYRVLRGTEKTRLSLGWHQNAENTWSSL